jgi:flagellar hook-associated protein FlgK
MTREDDTMRSHKILVARLIDQERAYTKMVKYLRDEINTLMNERSTLLKELSELRSTSGNE